MAAPIIGRQQQVGIALETTAGTAAAAQAWLPHMALTLDPKTDTLENTSGLGRMEQVSDSAIVEQYMEGSLNGRLYWNSFGYILANMFGSVAAAVHSGESAVYDNTFTVLQSSVLPSLTFTRVSPGIGASGLTEAFAMGHLTDLEIDVKQKGAVEFTATVQSKTGATTTATATYDNTEGDFTSKHVVVKIAGSVAGLSGATALQLKSVKLKISRKLDRFTPLGTVDPVSFDPNEYTFTGTIVQRWTDTTLQALATANTARAMSIAIVNTDRTIGSAANPGLTFTMPKVRFEPGATDNNLSQTLSQTFNFAAQLDAAVAGYACQAVLVSGKNGYAHA